MGSGIDDVSRGLCAAPTGIRSDEARQAIRKRVERILRTPAREYVSDPDDAALIALRDKLRIELTPPPEWIPEHLVWKHSSPPSNERLADVMVEREIARMEAAAEEAVPSPPLRQPNGVQALFGDWEARAAEQARTEYESYLLELGRMREAEHAESCSRLRWPGPDCPSPPTSRSPVTVDMYTYYLGPPVEAMARRVGAGMPQLVSLALDFVPVVGQLKGVAEAIIGRDLITGEKLAAWERGLNALLALLPSARGIFKAGKNGMEVLAQVARKSGLGSREVYRAMKGASELTEAEVKAAMAMQPRAVEKIAGTLDDMMGTVRRTPAKTNYRVANGLIENGQSVAHASTTSRDVAEAAAKAAATKAAKAEEAAQAAEAAAKAAKAAKVGQKGKALEEATKKASDAAKAARAARRAANKAAQEAAAAARKLPKPRAAPGKVVTPAKTPAAALAVMRAIDRRAIEALEKAGVKITEAAAYRLVESFAGFLNRFYRRPGFDKVVADLIGKNKDLRKGAELVVEFVSDTRNGIDPLTVAFEVPAGITKTARQGERVSRFTDLVVTVQGKSLSYEFKAYTKEALVRWAKSDKKILQMVKDVSMLGGSTVRWVFDSRVLSRDLVYEHLRKAIRRDPVLAKEFGVGWKLDAALDKLAVMYPPVPRAPRLPGLHGVTKAQDDDD